jgi:uncharacterized protein YjbI with pentapeptide repeats
MKRSKLHNNKGEIMKKLVITVGLLMVAGMCFGFKPEDLGKITKTCTCTTSCPKCDLSGTDLSGADLSEANLEGANLTEADLRGTNLSKANLKSTDLKHAKFGELYKRNGEVLTISRTDLRGADLTGAKNIDSKQLHFVYAKIDATTKMP